MGELTRVPVEDSPVSIGNLTEGGGTTDPPHTVVTIAVDTSTGGTTLTPERAEAVATQLMREAQMARATEDSFVTVARPSED